MKKIYFTIVLLVIGLLVATAAFNYHRPFIGNGGIDSITDGNYDSVEVFEIEDKKDNLGFPNAQRPASINSNDSGQIGGVLDTQGMLAVTSTDGKAGYDSDDNTIPPFVWDNSLIPALETPPGYRPVEIPSVINNIGRAIGYSGASGVRTAGGTSSDNINWEGIPDIYEDKDPEAVIEYNYDEVTLHPIPEPSTIFLFGSGLIGLGLFGRKKIKRS